MKLSGQNEELCPENPNSIWKYIYNVVVLITTVIYSSIGCFVNTLFLTLHFTPSIQTWTFGIKRTDTFAF